MVHFSEKEKENLKSLEDGLDEIFVENEKLCEDGITATEAIYRLEAINEKIAELQCLIPEVVRYG